ncbi:MAG: hypothetical protein AMS21_01395 [Gemmatimonas sp. SG8_38_2]|nr:MAG: hypothetical protein AMS21_01395 [Gemmatimonas sp. SG8_38_2]
MTMALVSVLAGWGCGGGNQDNAGGVDGAGGSSASLVLPGLGFVTSTFGFYYQGDPEAGLHTGFNLDGRVSSKEAPAPGECAHDDFVGSNGEPGIDYSFLRIINDEEVREDGKYVFGGFREGQIIDGVIGGAVKNGSMTILVQIQGLDDPRHDDDVRVRIFGSEDGPALGTDNAVLQGATLSVHANSRFHSSEVMGMVADGVLTAGPIDLRFPVDIMIVRDELFLHDAWLRLELEEDAFEGTIAGYWDVANIRDIIGKPTTDNGNAANFTIEQFDAAMREHADGDYDPQSSQCGSISTMFRVAGVQAFLVGAGEPGGQGGNGGDGGAITTPVDQCLNDADQAALEALASEEQSGPAVVGMIAGDCPLTACGAEVGTVLSDSSEEARNALGDCIARCISDQTGLSAGCTGCYGAIAACSTAFCIAPCLPPNSGSEECANCALENCIDVNACTGL